MLWWTDHLTEVVQLGQGLAPGFPGVATGKEPDSQCRRHKRCGFNPRVRKISWRRTWQPTPLFLPGESPWTEEPSRLQSIGSQRAGHDWRDSAYTHSLVHIKHRITRTKHSFYLFSPSFQTLCAAASAGDSVPPSPYLPPSSIQADSGVSFASFPVPSGRWSCPLLGSYHALKIVPVLLF